jgi:hypothetical protein
MSRQPDRQTKAGEYSSSPQSPSLFLILPVPPPFLLFTADAVHISMTIHRHFRCLELAWVSDLLQGGVDTETVDEMDDGATTGSEVPRTVEIDDVASMTVDCSL